MCCSIVEIYRWVVLRLPDQFRTRGTVETNKILLEIDNEIARLAEVRDLLANQRGSGASKLVRKKRTLSAAARKRIGDAQRKRWASQKNATAAAK